MNLARFDIVMAIAPWSPCGLALMSRGPRRPSQPQPWHKADPRLRRRVLHQRSHLRAKTRGRMQCDRRCLVIRMHERVPLAPTSTLTLIELTVPLPLRILTVAGIVPGAFGSPKLSYANERATCELDPVGLLGRWKEYHGRVSGRCFPQYDSHICWTGWCAALAVRAGPLSLTRGADLRRH